MTLLALGPAIDSDAIVRVEVEDSGCLTIVIELPLGEERIVLAESAVVPEVRALALSPGSERAA